MKNSIQKNLLITVGLGLLAILSTPVYAAGACSPYLGLATINELFRDKTNQDDDPDDFVEIKILDSSIPLATYSQWSIQLCEDDESGNNNDNDGCSAKISVGDFIDTTTPWLVLKDGTIGKYYNFKTGFDAILLDANDDVIDYLSVDGYGALEESGCTGASLPYDYQTGAPGASDKFIFRVPDGTGDWGSATSGAADPTEDTSNDAGANVPNLTFSDVVITQGTTTATITLSLDAASTDIISINFYTFDGSLFAGTDYTAVNTTSDIVAGGTSLTFNVPVSPTSNLGVINFFVIVEATSVGRASITDHVGQITVVGAPAVDHYSITHSGLGVTCEVELVTITAHDSADVAIAPSSSTTITLLTSIANDGWSLRTGNGTFTPPDQYTFDGTETSVEFWLSKTTSTLAPHIDIDISDGSATDLDDGGVEDASLEFRDLGLRFYANGVQNNIATQIAGKTSSQAPNNQVLTLRAVQKNTDTGACESILTNNQTVDFSLQCTNPNSCQRPIYMGTASPSTMVNGTAAVTLDFGDATQAFAEFALNYPDAGEIQLSAEHTLPNGVILNGSTDPFVVRPFGFDIDVPGNPGAINASGTKFVAAGSAFTVNVSAALWNSSDDSDNDGIPDNHNDTDPANNVDLSNNSVTLGVTSYSGAPNFGLEGEEITLSAVLFDPSGGNDPGLTGGTLIASFTSGAGSSITAQYNEVGIIEISAGITDLDYLGIAAETAGMISQSGHVGRFYPDHFVLSDQLITNRSDIPACISIFTYAGENFEISYDLTAMSVGGGNVTQNYTTANGFAKLDTAAELDYGAVDTSIPVNLTTRLNTGTPAINFVAGVANDLIDTLSLSRLATGPDGPHSLSVGIAPLDDDGVQIIAGALDLDVTGGGNDHGLIGMTIINYGRAVVENTFGSELIALDMPMQVEMYDGANFVTNVADSCTSLPIGRLILSNNVESGQIDGDIQVLALGGQTSNATIANDPVLAGNAGLSFCPPGNPACTPTSGNAGFIDVQIDLTGLYPWLQYDWNGDTTFNNNPTATATFGIYSGNDVNIYQIQTFQ